MATGILAALGTGVSVAASIYQQRQDKLRAALTKSGGALSRVVGGAALGGGAGVFVARQVSNVGQGNIIPGIPTMKQFQSGLEKTGIPTFDIGGAPRRKYRRMNLGNIKALRRAGRRVEGFVRLAKSLVSMPGARAKHPIKGRRRRR